ncbi:histidine phosphatase family protein [Actinopolymorpha rutila]|uniref:Broad specificity phosphatase PhoE n=1 Tax=Actinopolymorpha rutila TaxID=446787 RepID=A0A852ZHJ3_9ACTN|nr:histidine phosphatase family protein [Actinopolymorpha rutila]NYH92547.1 broad specificity phosphatase PhoE [Actinopolymorpha rutila]
MLPTLDGFTLELVPHCSSVPREGWSGEHRVRPLSEEGHAQARALVGALGIDVDAIYSSPALRCRQTVSPLADVVGLTVIELAELDEAAGFGEPSEWIDGIFAPVGMAIGGAWSAGRAVRALALMARSHPGGRVVASSHGDVIPVFLSLVAGMYARPLPAVVDRGGWYRLRFATGTVTLTGHDEVATTAR